MMKVRAYEPADAAAMAVVHRHAFPDRPARPVANFRQHLEQLLAAGGRGWVIAGAHELAGYVTVSPVPGLDGVVALAGGIHPQRWRQGLGSRLLTHIINELRECNVRQLSYCVKTLDSPAAHFLRHHHFYVEHEEWLLILDDLAHLPPLPAAHLRAFSRSLAIPEFCALYQQSFAGLPWYQPYTPAEAAAILDDPADLRFLIIRGKPVGFVWIHRPDATTGQIEPLGVATLYQGRGYGRTLLLSGLHRLASQGCQAVKIGLWRDNLAALNLYQSLGFRQQKTLTYLACDISL